MTNPLGSLSFILLLEVLLPCALGGGNGKESLLGGTGELSCSFRMDSLSAPDLEMRWELNNVPLSRNEDKRQMTVSKSADGALETELMIYDVDWSDEGLYSCIAYEPGKEDAHRYKEMIHLNVLASPSVTDTTNGKEVVGNSTEISCHYSGKPLPDIKWLSSDGKIILEDSLKYEISFEERSDSEIISYLKIMNLIREDNGTYLCHGENAHGSSVAVMVVEILDKPSVYLDFATPVGMSSIYLNWTVKSWNSPILDYILKYRKETDDNWVYYIDEKIPPTSSSVVINELDTNSSYLIELAAKNALGTSEYNRYHSQVTTLDFNPDYIPEVTIKGLTWNFVSISWTIPDNLEQKEHIHQYKLTRKTHESEVDMYQSSNRPPSYLWRHLDPATEYTFTVSACNSYTRKCGFPSQIVVGTTEDGLSGPPAKVEIYCRYDNISGTSFVDVKWGEPEKKYGKIQFYNVHLNGKAVYMDQTGAIISDDWGPKHKTEDSSVFHTRFDFLPSNTNYTVKVCAITRRKQCGQVVSKSCMMKSTPPRPEILNRFQWFADSSVEGRGVFRLRVPKLSERSGKICCARVVVVKLKPGQTVLQLPHQSELPLSTYRTVSNQEGGAYIAEIIGPDLIGQDILVGDGENVVSTNIGSCPSCLTGLRSQLIRETAKRKSLYMENERSKTPRRLHKRFDKVLESEGLRVEDGFLSEDHNYTAFVEVVVVGGEVGRSGFMSIRRPGESPSVLVSPVNAILVSALGVLSGLILVALFLFVAFCLLKRYSKEVAVNQGVEMDLRRSFRHFCSTWGRGGVRQRDHSQYLITPETSPPEIKPINKDDLVAAFKDRHKDSDYGFQAEFELLPDKFPDRTTLNCEMPINRVKNRYPDIKSYDQTRVKLTPIEGVEGSDYINANFVVGYKERKRWVCAQGPLEHTITDFWKMIWEQGVEIIIMLTNLEEYNRVKCAQYWPGAGDSTYGNAVIRFCTEKRYSDYVVRELSVTMNKGVGEEKSETESRTVYHYHYLQWKDFNAPEHAPGMLKFVKRINEASSGVAPMCVHCSAGVGRSGTLIAIDSLIEQLRDEGSVTIFQMVSDLRHQRNYLVQSVKQYMFVYRAIMEMAQFGDTELKAESIKGKWTDSNSHKSFEDEFNRLTKVVDDRKALSVGSNDENKYKNQSDHVIPFDRNRVILTPDGLKPHSTYINASFIEGYHNDESFIITQDPLPGTMEDFWRMVTEHNISVMVMLSGDDASIIYWEDKIGVVKEFGSLKITLLTKEPLTSYVKREFSVVNSKAEEEVKLTHFEYSAWVGGEKSLPPLTHGFLDLAEHSMAYKVEAKLSGPVAVHCRFGSNRSSVYVGLCCLIQQIKIESRADIFTVVRKLRSQRQGMIQELDHYKFLYRILSDYVDLYLNKDGEYEYSIPVNSVNGSLPQVN